MKDTKFIEEFSSKQKIKSVVGTISVMLVIVVLGVLFSTIWLTTLTSIPWVQTIIDFVKQDVIKLTLSGLFFMHFIGGLFFIPSPEEIFFYAALLKGNNIFFAFLVSIIGYLLAQLVNYGVGLKLSNSILHIVSKRKVYKARRFANKYGTFGIFIFNLLPFPAPILTLGFGIVKYNMARLFFWTLLGKVGKYGVLIVFYILTH